MLNPLKRLKYLFASSWTKYGMMHSLATFRESVQFEILIAYIFDNIWFDALIVYMLDNVWFEALIVTHRQPIALSLTYHLSPTSNLPTLTRPETKNADTSSRSTYENPFRLPPHPKFRPTSTQQTLKHPPFNFQRVGG